MIRYVVFILLIVIGSIQWVSSNVGLLAWQAWRWLSTIIFDPGHASPVVVGGALIVLCAAMMFRHVTAWLVAYVALLSIPVAAFAAAMALMTPANLAIRSGAGNIVHTDGRTLPTPAVAPLHGSQLRPSTFEIALPR